MSQQNTKMHTMLRILPEDGATKAEAAFVVN